MPENFVYSSDKNNEWINKNFWIGLKIINSQVLYSLMLVLKIL